MLLALSLGVLQFLNHLLLITSLEEVTWGESERFVGHRIMIKYSFLNGQLGKSDKLLDGISFFVSCGSIVSVGHLLT